MGFLLNDLPDEVRAQYTAKAKRRGTPTGPRPRARNAAETEAELQARITRLFAPNGWRWQHQRKVQDHRGRWLTAIDGDRGFPDLMATRAGVPLWLELKSAKGKLGTGQPEWLDALPPANAFVVRPADFATVEAIVTSPPHETAALLATLYEVRQSG